ncbi:MAG: hypothetical protein ISS14_05700 [Actinobacteria bacterium]|nr:hypothetical protein [Actinomycetota bacterium]
MESGSTIYAQTYSANIGLFVDEYEYGDKGIKFIYQGSDEYSIDNMRKDLENGVTVYSVGDDKFIELNFETEKLGKTYYFDWFKEDLKLYRLISFRKMVNIGYKIDSLVEEFGEEFTIEYIIKNNSSAAIKINSVELELPQNIKFVSVGPDGYINQGPGMSRGMYMWVSDNYIIDSKSEINLKVSLKGVVPEKSVIKFRVTTNDSYINCDDVEIEIRS